MLIKLKKLKKNAKLPERGTEQAAGYDLFAAIDKNVTINANETVKIGTGIAIEIPDGYFGAVFARSGLSTKEGLRPANCVGVIDSDYRGEIIVALHNDNSWDKGILGKKIVPGQKIAQLVIMPYLSVDFQEVEELEDTARGTGGFGHTGE